jgi:hypothetical protein
MQKLPHYWYDALFEGGNVTHEHCVNYLLSLANAYRDAKRAENLVAQT